MNRHPHSIAKSLLAGIAIVAVFAVGSVAWAQTNTSEIPTDGRQQATGQQAAGKAVVPAGATKNARILTLDAAQRLAKAAQNACEQRGYQVTVSVVDRDGVELATIRDEDATGATVATATGKAYAAVGFRLPTAQLQQFAPSNPGIVTVPDFVVLPGGQPINAGNQLVGGIGVSGAPSGEIDDQCIDAAVKATS